MTIDPNERTIAFSQPLEALNTLAGCQVFYRVAPQKQDPSTPHAKEN